MFRHLWPVVRALAARYLPPVDVEDVAQMALLKLFERASDFDPARDAAAWAVGLAMWEIRTCRRRAWRRRDKGDLEEASALAGCAASPEELAIASDLAAAVGRTLSTLSPEDRDALLQFARDERTIGAGYRKRLQRARDRMRTAWRLNHE